MNLAVKLWRDERASDPLRLAGIPGDWPSEAVELGETTDLPAGPYQLMTTVEFRAYRAARKPVFDAWQAGVEAAEKTARRTAVAELLALFDNFQTAEGSWPLLTLPQQAQLMREHNLALLVLRPMLRELFERSTP